MKNISKIEVFVGLIIVVLLMSGLGTLMNTTSSLKTFGINLYELLFAKHITWFVVKGILALLSGVGIWLGPAKSKLLFSGILILIVLSFF
jgi:hypothetical protein